MAAEQRVVELVIDASGVERGTERAALAYDHMGARADAAATRAQASFDRQFQSFSTRLPRSIDQVANAYDSLQGKLDPVFNAQLRAEREMTQSLGVINRAVLLGVTTEEQATRDITRLKQLQVEAINRVKEAQTAANAVQAVPRMHRAANDNFNVSNLAFQGQDIFTTAPTMPWYTVALQQGPQVASVISSMEKPAAGLAAAFASIVSPLSLVTIGLVGAAAAGIGYLTNLLTGTKETEEALKRHADLIRDLKGAYGEAAGGLEDYMRRSSAETGAAARLNLKSSREELKDASQDFAFSYMPSGGLFGRSAFDPAYEAFRKQITDLGDDAKVGKANMQAFRDEIEAKVQADPTLRNKADELLAAGDAAFEADRKVRQAEAAIGILEGKASRAAGTVTNLSRALRELNQIAPPQVSEQDRISAAARNAERAASGLTGVAAEEARRRILIAETRARQRALDQDPQIVNSDGNVTNVPIPGQKPNEFERDPAAIIETTKAGADRVRQLRQEIDALGLTAGAAARLRYEQEQLNDAVDKHIELSPQQRAQIEQDAAAIGVMTDKLSQMRLQQDAQFESDQLFRTDREARIASQLRGSGVEVDLGGQNAAMLRTIDLLKEQKKAWEDIRDVGKDAVDQIVDSATGGFEDITDVFNGIAKDVLKQFTTLGVANPLKNAIFGGELPTMDTVGGIGGIFKALTGGSNPAMDAASRSVGAMSVTAASVVVNGGVGSAVTGLAGQAANGNDPFAAVLKNDPALAGSGEKLAWNFWKSKGLADHQVAGVLGNIKAESAFNPSVDTGDGGKAWGLYQWNDRRHSMVEAVGADWKNNPLAQHEFAYKELMGPENRAWKALLASQDTKGATAAFAGFERPRGFSWDNPEAAHNFVGRLNGANESLSKLGGTANVATQGLGTLGNGLGQLGNAFQQAGTSGAPASGGGGGIFGWLGSLFGGGGVSPTSSSWQANTTLSSVLGLPGYADGIDSAPGGYSWVGERGKELMRVPRGAEIIPAHRTAAVLAPSTPSVTFNSRVINNASSVNVEERETTDENGGRGVDYVISDRLATAASKRGGAFDRQLRARGATMPRTRR